MLRQCNRTRLQELCIPTIRNSVFRLRVARSTEHFNIQGRYASTKGTGRSAETTEDEEQGWRRALLGNTEGDHYGRDGASPLTPKTLRPRPPGLPKGDAQQQGEAPDSKHNLGNATSSIVRRLRLSKAKQRVYEPPVGRAVKALQDVKATDLAEQQGDDNHVIRYHRSHGAFVRPGVIRHSVDQPSKPPRPHPRALEKVVEHGKAKPRANKAFRKVGYRDDGTVRILKFLAYRESASERLRRRFRRWERNSRPAMDYKAKNVTPTSEREPSEKKGTYHQDNDERSDVFFTERLNDAINNLTYAPPKAPATFKRVEAPKDRRLPRLILRRLWMERTKKRNDFRRTAFRFRFRDGVEVRMPNSRK